jgi:hypothetical protein
MIRVGVIVCFALTLLCPIFCLAGTSDECSDHALRNTENCEAMSIGAVVEKSDLGAASRHQFLPTIDGFSLPATAARGVDRRLRATSRQREHAKSPPIAARRQAILQIFLF